MVSESWYFTTEEEVNVDDETLLPVSTALVGNFPNPFNPETTIRFTLSHAENVEINIYNVRGQLIRTLVNGYVNGGRHNVVWNGLNDNGNPVGSGVYFYRMTAGEYQSVRRMMLIK